MKRALAALLVCSGCSQAIGTLRPDALEAAGRPLEAWEALLAEADPDDDARLLALHQAALLHAGGDWAGSEAAFSRAELTPGDELLPEEYELAARVRATNALALSQNPAAFAAAFPMRPLLPAAPGQGKVVLVFEASALAPVGVDPRFRGRALHPGAMDGRARWQLDEESASEAAVVAVAGPALHQPRPRRQLGDPRWQAMAEALTRHSRWWSVPTQWRVAERDLAPGLHVVTCFTTHGRRARLVDVAAGRTVFLVVPQ